MTERDGYPPGVPCWVDTMRDDPEDAVFSVSQLIVPGA